MAAAKPQSSPARSWHLYWQEDMVLRWTPRQRVLLTGICLLYKGNDAFKHQPDLTIRPNSDSGALHTSTFLNVLKKMSPPAPQIVLEAGQQLEVSINWHTPEPEQKRLLVLLYYRTETVLESAVPLRIFDSYLVDPKTHTHRYDLTSHTRLFIGSSSCNPFICNFDWAGQLPDRQRAKIERIGLGLCFTDPKIYDAVFRYLLLHIYVGDKRQFSCTSRDFLDLLETKREEADWAGRDPDEHVGLCWSLPISPPVEVPPRQPFWVEMLIQTPLCDMLNAGRAEVLAKNPEYADWYAAIRVMLIGKKTRENF